MNNSDFLNQFAKIANKSKLQIAFIFIISFLIFGLIIIKQNSNPKFKGSVLIIGKLLEDDIFKKYIKNFNSNLEEKNIYNSEEESLTNTFDFFRKVGLSKVEAKSILIKDKNINGFELNFLFTTASIQNVSINEVYDMFENYMENRFIESDLYNLQRKNLENSIYDLEQIIDKAIKRENLIYEVVENNNNNSIMIMSDSYLDLSSLVDAKNKLMLDLSYLETDNLVIQHSDIILENDNTRKILVLINVLFISTFLSLSLIGIKYILQR